MKTMPKKWIGLLVTAALACSIAGLAGCSAQGANSSAASTSSATASGESTSSTSATASVANPWNDVESAQEAAKGAGLDAFALPEGEIADLGKPFDITYRCMDGMAEARLEFPTSAITARTSVSEGIEKADISGDYNTYAYEWTEEIGGITLMCAGNREGESTKTYWSSDGLHHSLVAEGLGGDVDFGLTAERLAVFVEAMR